VADLPIKVDTKGGPRGRTAGPMEVAKQSGGPSRGRNLTGTGAHARLHTGGRCAREPPLPEPNICHMGCTSSYPLDHFRHHTPYTYMGSDLYIHWVPTCTCVTCCVQCYICIGSEQVYLSSVLRWCHAPEHHARSPAPARPASLLLHDAPAHVPPCTHHQTPAVGGPHLKMCLEVQTGAIMNASVVRVSR
jgi:hypothetical protein